MPNVKRTAPPAAEDRAIPPALADMSPAEFIQAWTGRADGPAGTWNFNQARCPVCNEYLHIIQLRTGPGFLCGCGEKEATYADDISTVRRRPGRKNDPVRRRRGGPAAGNGRGQKRRLAG